MGRNSVVSSYPKSIGIPQVDGLSTGPPGFGPLHTNTISTSPLIDQFIFHMASQKLNEAIPHVQCVFLHQYKLLSCSLSSQPNIINTTQ